MSCTSLIFRRPIPDDWERVLAVMPAWWDGRDLRALLPKIFFEHFRSSSLLVEHEDALIGFLVGFCCPDHDDEAYIHFAGVHPAWRAPTAALSSARSQPRSTPAPSPSTRRSGSRCCPGTTRSMACP